MADRLSEPVEERSAILLQAWRGFKGWSTATTLQVTIVLAYLTTTLYIISSPGLPPLRLPISPTPDWTSWFDVAVAYPILVVGCTWILRRELVKEVLAAAAVVTFIPMYHVIESYLVLYSPSATVPGDVLYLSFAVISVAIVFFVRLHVTGLSGRSLLVPSRKELFWLVAVLSVGIAWLQIGLRLSTHPPLLTSWVSDIGITADAGARDLLHGINPYATPLPPWGGPASLLYGPVGLGLLAPFALLPRGWGALVGSTFFAVLTALGVRKCVSYWRPNVATEAGLLFLALPTTSWAMEAGLAPYLIASAMIVWSIALRLGGRPMTSSFVLLLGTLTALVPAILLIPFLLYSSRREVIRIVAGFALPMSAGVAAAVRLVGPALVVTKLKELVYIGSFGFYRSLGLAWSEFFALAILCVVVEWAVLTRSTTSIHSHGAEVTLSAEILVLVPLVFGSDFPAVYVMAGCVLVILLSLDRPLKSLGPDAKPRMDPPLVESHVTHARSGNFTLER